LALTPGTRLGVYEVTAPIGEGGMGQVYRAADTTLGRQVAIKILPDAFASDPAATLPREEKCPPDACEYTSPVW
jgi:serine/threonine protein kinase